MRTLKTVTTFFALCIAQSLLAGTEGSPVSFSRVFYFDAGLGAAFSNTYADGIGQSNSVLYSPTSIGTSLFSLPNIHWENQFRNGYSFHFSAGHYFGSHWHGGLEFLYHNIQRDSYGTYDWLEQNSLTGAVHSKQPNNPISKIATRANIYTLLPDVGLDLGAFPILRPFVAGGIGVSWLQSDRAQTNNTLNINDPIAPLVETAPALQNSPYLYGTAFTWVLKAGFNYYISERATAILQYRFFKTTSFKSSASTIITNPGADGQSIFSSPQNDLKGLLIQSVEVILRFNV